MMGGPPQAPVAPPLVDPRLSFPPPEGVTWVQRVDAFNQDTPFCWWLQKVDPKDVNSADILVVNQPRLPEGARPGMLPG